MKGTTYLIYDFLFDLPHWIRILLPVSLQSDNCFCEQNGKNTTILRAEANHHKVNVGQVQICLAEVSKND